MNYWRDWSVYRPLHKGKEGFDSSVKILIIYLWLVMHRYRILSIFDNSILTSDWYPIPIWYYIYLVVYDAFNDIFSILIGIK